MTQPFVLICGCPRSGTYLFAAELGAAFDIAIPVESHFIPHFHRFRNLWHPLSDGGQKLVAAIMAYSRVWIYRGTRGLDLDKLSRTSVLATAGLAVSGETYADIVTGLFRSYARLKGAALFGDKSAPFDPENLEAFDESVHNIRVIHLVRDPRDVALSWCSQWFGPKDMTEAAQQWKKHVLAYRAWGSAHPEKYREVRFEDFVRDPAGIYDSLSSFLGAVPVDGQSSANLELRNSMVIEKSHAKIKDQPDPQNVGKWQNAMSREHKSLFDRLLAEEMATFSYPTSGLPASGPSPADSLVQLRLGCRRVVGSLYLMRRLRSVAPLGLWLAQRLGVDLDHAIYPRAPRRQPFSSDTSDKT